MTTLPLKLKNSNLRYAAFSLVTYTLDLYLSPLYPVGDTPFIYVVLTSSLYQFIADEFVEHVPGMLEEVKAIQELSETHGKVIVSHL